jgi:hypothetical protein
MIWAQEYVDLRAPLINRCSLFVINSFDLLEDLLPKKNDQLHFGSVALLHCCCVTLAQSGAATCSARIASFQSTAKTSSKTQQDSVWRPPTGADRQHACEPSEMRITRFER